MKIFLIIVIPLVIGGLIFFRVNEYLKEKRSNEGETKTLVTKWRGSKRNGTTIDT